MTPVEPPASIDEIVKATLGGAGLEVVQRVRADGEPDVELLRATSSYDAGTTRAYQTASGRYGTEIDASQLPTEEDLGVNWFIDGQGYTQEPGSATARRASGDLGGFMLSDGSGADDDSLAEALAAMLDGWPGVVVSDAELVDQVPAYHTRFERGNDDVLDVWIDRAGGLMRVERRSDRAVALVMELSFRSLDEAPSIPSLPELEP
ncbi:MAG: hypothetical protein ABIP17_04090 [Ilumatobacteraceae bacterium]